MRSTDVNQTDLELTFLSNIFMNVRRGNFHRFLPSSVVKVVNEKDGNERDGKKARAAAGNAVENKNKVKEWQLRSNEVYEKIFGGRKKEGISPKLSVGCFPCPKYHVKGYCFKDCKNKNSHRILEGEDRRKTDQFIKQLRGE